MNNGEKTYLPSALTNEEKVSADVKQIEEILMIIDDVACGNIPEVECDTKDSCAHCRSERLYNAGYRKQREGEWILTGTFKSPFPLPVADLHISCGVCGWKPPKYSDDYKKYNFCPNCGAKMKGV